MIKREYPSRILITGGHEVGGVSSFAETLAEGFAALGISAEIVSPSRIFARWRDLRDPRVLKILSTTAVFAAPFSRRAICVAHGFPRPDVQGWMKALGVTASFKVAGWFAQLVAVSYYSAIHLRTIFNLRVDAVIHNPLNDAFLADTGKRLGRARLHHLCRAAAPIEGAGADSSRHARSARRTSGAARSDCRRWRASPSGGSRGLRQFANRACRASAAERGANVAAPHQGLRLRMRDRSARNRLS